MPQSIQTNRQLRLPKVIELTGLSKSSIYRLEALNLFPQRCKIGLRAVSWPEDEVMEWSAQRKAERVKPVESEPIDRPNASTTRR